MVHSLTLTLTHVTSLEEIYQTMHSFFWSLKSLFFFFFKNDVLLTYTLDYIKAQLSLHELSLENIYYVRTDTCRTIQGTYICPMTAQ